MGRVFCVYILSSDFYIGVTNNPNGESNTQDEVFNDGSFNSRYDIHRLVHIESFQHVRMPWGAKSNSRG